MQGFNMGRYRPYDVDPSKESFNARSGKHPLGKRAHKLDQGILVVRFELPFNIWCGGCGGHIGQGVRYNAEKKRVGEYYSTPIYRFRCKTACCQHFFEIETDPKNTRYVIVSGAKEQSKEWDPAENGGHPIYDDSSAGPSTSALEVESDPFSALEKQSSDKKRAEARKARLDELEAAASARSADPYTLNSKVRSYFRQEKKQRLRLEAKDEELRKRIGWNADRALSAAATPKGEIASHQVWAEARDEQAGVGRIARGQRVNFLREDAGKRPLDEHARSLATQKSASKPADALAARIISNTRSKVDPFAIQR